MRLSCQPSRPTAIVRPTGSRILSTDTRPGVWPLRPVENIHTVAIEVLLLQNTSISFENDWIHSCTSEDLKPLENEEERTTDSPYSHISTLVEDEIGMLSFTFRDERPGAEAFVPNS